MSSYSSTEHSAADCSGEQQHPQNQAQSMGTEMLDLLGNLSCSARFDIRPRDTWYCPTVTFKESVTDPHRNPACFDPGLEQEVKMGLVLRYEIPRSLPYFCVRIRDKNMGFKRG